ncbi:methyl-accepting chemotaxis protein [bacterium]|nr:methyl-accepting chemotaxis protein [bacterium]
MTLSQKILSLPIIVALFMIGLSAIVITRLSDIDTSVRQVTRTLAPEASESAAQMQNFMERDMLVRRYLQTNDDAYVQKFKDLRAEATSIANNFKNIRQSQEQADNGMQRDLLVDIGRRDASYSQIFLDNVVQNNTVVNSKAQSLLNVIGPSIVKSLTDTIATAHSDDEQATANAATVALQSFQTARIFVGQFLLSNSATDASRVEMQLLGVDNAFYDLANLISEPRRLALAKDAKEKFDSFTRDFNTIVSAVNDRNEALSGVLTSEIESIKKLAQRQQSEVWAGLNASGHNVEETVGATIKQVILTAGIAFILGMIPAIFVTRNIKRAIRNTVTVADGIAHGELDQDIEVKSKDETGQLLSSLDEMVNQLTGVVSKIQSSATTVNSGASQISKGNQDLSKSTEKQVAILTETASQVTELTAIVKQNTIHAMQANDLAKATRSRAEGSSEVIASTVVAMSEINNSSNKISNIIGVIDEIAFQTNLLALNAAVEAARAGESGRGFAVVASEVRSLAGRSAVAAKEIKDLIADSNHKVELGTELVNRSRDTLSEIVTEVSKVSDVVNEISTASEQQSIAIDQVSETINAMNQLTSNNSVLVDKLANAGSLLSSEADALSGMTSFFKSTRTSEASMDDSLVEVKGAR